MSYNYTWYGQLYSYLFRDIPNFFKNIWKFRKALWSHHWWDSYGTLFFIEIGVEDISNYISKYPHAKRVVLSDEKLSNYRNTEKGLALAMGIVRHRKAKKLLFKILHDRIEYWWD